MKGRLKALYSATFLTAALMSGCAPQINYLSVDVRKNAELNIPVGNKSCAIFSVAANAKHDSIRVANVAIGFAEQLEADKNIESGKMPVYSIGAENYWISDANGQMVADKEYVRALAADSDAELLFFINKIKYQQYTVQKVSGYSGYEGFNVVLPYMVGLDLFDGANAKQLHSSMQNDSLFLFVDSSVSENNVGGVIAKKLPDISRRIGAELAKSLSPQWVTQQRILMTYAGNSDWEEAYALAEEFQWKEAIEKWMEFSDSKDAKKAAFASYNIAVGCEMLEQFDLAVKWLDYSMSLFPMKETEIYRRQLDQYRAGMKGAK
jgi:tetratricopeptide (TPR) repeat protein